MNLINIWFEVFLICFLNYLKIVHPKIACDSIQHLCVCGCVHGNNEIMAMNLLNIKYPIGSNY